MALIVEDGSGVTGANTYASISTVADYIREVHGQDHAFLQASETTETITSDDVTFTAGTKQITFAAAHGLDVEEGDWIRVEGATSSTNLGQKQLASVASDSLIVLQSLADEVAGPKVTVTKIVPTLTDEQERIIREAMEVLEYSWRWAGYRTDSDQALLWPRYNLDDEDGYALDGETVPERILKALYEIARRIAEGVNFWEDQDRGGLIKSERVGPIETVYQNGASGGTEYKQIEDLIRPFLAVSSGGLLVMR